MSFLKRLLGIKEKVIEPTAIDKDGWELAAGERKEEIVVPEHVMNEQHDEKSEFIKKLDNVLGSISSLEGKVDENVIQNKNAIDELRAEQERLKEEREYQRIEERREEMRIKSPEELQAAVQELTSGKAAVNEENSIAVDKKFLQTFCDEMREVVQEKKESASITNDIQTSAKSTGENVEFWFDRCEVSLGSSDSRTIYHEDLKYQSVIDANVMELAYALRDATNNADTSVMSTLAPILVDKLEHYLSYYLNATEERRVRKRRIEEQLNEANKEIELLERRLRDKQIDASVVAEPEDDRPKISGGSEYDEKLATVIKEIDNYWYDNKKEKNLAYINLHTQRYARKNELDEVTRKRLYVDAKKHFFPEKTGGLNEEKLNKISEESDEEIEEKPAFEAEEEEEIEDTEDGISDD